MQGARVTPERAVEAHPVARVQNAASFFWRHGDVDIGRLRQRETAQDGVAVGTAAPDFHVWKISAMPKAQNVAQEVDLAIGIRPAGVLIDLLQHDEVGIVSSDDVRDAQGIVESVDAADALVDVVAEDLEAHVTSAITVR